MRLVGLVVLFTAMAWAPSLVSIGDLNLNFIIALALLLQCSVRGFTRPLFAPGDEKVTLSIVLAALAIMMACLLWMPYVEEPFRVFRTLYPHLIMVVMLVSVACIRVKDASKAADRLKAALIYGCVISSMMSVAAFFYAPLGRIFFTEGYDDRTAALFKNPNQFGIAISLVAPLIVAQIFEPGRKRVLVSMQIGIVFAGLALSGSKTNLLIFGVSTTVMVLTLMARTGLLTRNPLASLGVLVGFGAAGGLAIVTLGKLNARAVNTIGVFLGQGEARSLSSRQVLWNEAFQIGAANPLTGIGAGQRAYQGYFPHSHNAFLDYFRMLGIPGMLFISITVFAVLALALRAAFSGSRVGMFASVGLSFGLVNYLVANQLSDSFGPSTYAMFCIVVAALLLERKWANSANPSMAGS